MPDKNKLRGSKASNSTDLLAPKMITETIKTERPLTQSDLLNALQEAMSPIFDHLEEELLRGDGKQLDIQITVESGRIKLKYGVGDIIS